MTQKDNKNNMSFHFQHPLKTKPVIADFDAYADVEGRYPRTIGNDYMLPSGLRRLFEFGVMTVEADERALFMFERRHGFTKLRFRLLDIAAEIATQEELLATYLTYHENRYPDIAANWLLSQGFIKSHTMQRHSAAKVTGILSTEGVERASAEEAYAELCRHFSFIEADLSCRELFEGALCVRSSLGKPLGMLYMGQTLSIAVAAEARGKGVGQRLYRAYAAYMLLNNNKTVFHEWIHPDNIASIKMFSHLGFSADKVFTDCYVKS